MMLFAEDPICIYDREDGTSDLNEFEHKNCILDAFNEYLSMGGSYVISNLVKRKNFA